MTPEERQGYLGKLEELTIIELKDLLCRQEKLLSKQNFLKTLPDKGIKVKKFADKLEKLVHEKTIFEKIQCADDMLQQTSLQVINPTSAFSSVHLQTENDISTANRPSNNNEQLKLLINPAALLCDKKQIKDKRENICIDNDENITDDLRKSLQSIRLSQTIMEKINVEPSMNSYERVLKRAEQRSHKKKEAFKPNSSLMISKVKELPDKYKYKSNKSDLSIVDKTINHHHATYSEESAACPPQYKHDKCKLISSIEAVELIRQQAIKQEELKVEHAATKLTERLNIKMDSYIPDIVDMAYRNPADSDDDDDDDVDDGDGCKISSTNEDAHVSDEDDTCDISEYPD